MIGKLIKAIRGRLFDTHRPDTATPSERPGQQTPKEPSTPGSVPKNKRTSRRKSADRDNTRSVTAAISAPKKSDHGKAPSIAWSPELFPVFSTDLDLLEARMRMLTGLFIQSDYIDTGRGLTSLDISKVMEKLHKKETRKLFRKGLSVFPFSASSADYELSGAASGFQEFLQETGKVRGIAFARKGTSFSHE